VQRDDDGGDEKDGRDFGTHRLFAPLAAFDRATRGRMQPGRIRAKAIRMPIVGPRHRHVYYTIPFVSLRP
jgi:hypothetical protein